MKKIYLLFAFLIFSGAAMATPNPPACPNGCCTPGTALPINSNIYMLFAAAIVVGIVAISRYKKAATVKA
jgi:hypothetical protein